MKYFLLFFFLTSCAYWKAGYDSDPVKLKEYIINEPGLTSNQLYDAANTYISRQVKNKQFHTSIEDREAGKLVGFTVIYVDGMLYKGSNVKFKYEIDTKDGKIRCRFSYPEVDMPDGKGGWYWSSMRSIKAYEELLPSWEAIPNEIVKLARKEENW